MGHIRKLPHTLGWAQLVGASHHPPHRPNPLASVPLGLELSEARQQANLQVW